MTERCKATCTECGKRRMVWLINDETRLCNSCIEDLGYLKCDYCGEFFPSDYVRFAISPDNRLVCEYCMEDFP